LGNWCFLKKSFSLPTSFGDCWKEKWRYSIWENDVSWSGLHKEGRVGVAASQRCLVFMCDIRTVCPHPLYNHTL
jgi:hypothetical protein